MTKYDALGFGALNIDKLFKVNKIAGQDEESFVIDYSESCGGSAANTIVGMARLGMKTSFIGKVADDREGKLLLDNFKREEVDTQGIVVARRGRSGVVMGFVDKEGERALYVDPGVNDIIGQKEVNLHHVRNTRLIHLTSFVGEMPLENQKKLVEQLPEDVKVSFDPGMLYAEKGMSILRPIIQRAFVVLPNEVELKMLTGTEYKEGIKKLLNEGPKVVAVKLNKKGCFVSNGEESHLVEPFRVKIVDTTGAGDAWNAGFLYGLLKNKSLMECGRIGNFVASRCIMKLGARAGLPKLADLHQIGING
ncbi:MAG: carbohydrate kinase family protein [Candidatus Bathyarchaeota archaeon]|nr:MAG: carbohydrate kinase family protein [Candidatus Bathyarchaeota archaeon]